jgi:hypothetical protein
VNDFLKACATGAAFGAALGLIYAITSVGCQLC